MDEISFTIFGEPTAKGRPHVATIGGKAMAYTPAKTRRAEQDFRAQAIAFKPDKPITAAVTLLVFAYRTIPKSFSKKKYKLANEGTLRPTTRPDIDNYAKLVLDAMNGVFFADDSQIIELVVYKYYSESPRIHVQMRWEE